MTDSLERVRRLRARRAAAGKKRVDVYLSQSLLAQVQRFAAQTEISLAEAVEQILATALKKGKR